MGGGRSETVGSIPPFYNAHGQAQFDGRRFYDITGNSTEALWGNGYIRRGNGTGTSDRDSRVKTD